MNKYELQTHDELYNICLIGYTIEDALLRAKDKGSVMLTSLIEEYGSPLDDNSQWYIDAFVQLKNTPHFETPM